MVPAYNIVDQEAVFFHSDPKFLEGMAVHIKIDHVKLDDVKIWEVMRGTVSAPTYFPPGKLQAKLDTGAEVQVGVNKYRLENEEQNFEVLKIDNAEVRTK